MNRPERFNAKARRSSATSSHKRGKQSRSKRQPVADTNPEVLPRKSTEEKEIDRREELKKEVRVLRPYMLARSYPIGPRSYSRSLSRRHRARRGRGWINTSCVNSIYLIEAENL